MNHLRRLGVVLEAFAHLAPVLGEQHARDDAVAKSRFVEESCRQHREGVEPASGLVKSFGDEVGGEIALEVLSLLEGIVVLAVGHGTGLEPAIKYFRNAPQCAFAIGRWQFDVVNEMFVQIIDRMPTQAFELGATADTDGFARFLVAPYRQRCAPVAITRDVPVACTGQPLAESSVADVLGDPPDLAVGRQHALLDFLDPDEPSGDRPVYEGRVATVTKRIRVDDGALGEKLAAKA